MNRVIGVGVLAACLSQYAWMFPVPRFYAACVAVATACALVGLVMTALQRRGHRP